MEGPRPLLNQLQIVVRVKLPFVVAKEPWVSGELFAVMEDLQAGHGEMDLDLQTGIEGGYGIAILIYDHRGIGIHFTGRGLDDGERHVRQRQETGSAPRQTVR